jgi:hypothetical protein
MPLLTPLWHHRERNTVQHSARHRKETCLDMRHLQSPAHPATRDRSLVMSGKAVRVRSSALYLLRFAGKTLSGALAPALRQGRFTATRLLRSTHHSSCCLIFDSRWYLTPLRRNGTIASGLTSYSSREPRSKQHVFPRESRATNSPLSSYSPQRRSSSALALLLLPASPHTSRVSSRTHA